MFKKVRSSTVFWVWDSNSTPEPQSGELVCNWNGYENAKGTISILSYIDEHAEGLRGKYLQFVNDLGEFKVGKKRVIDHLTLDSGVSHWWLSMFVEKSIYKSPITDAMRLLALEEILDVQCPKILQLTTSNKVLMSSVADLCSRSGIEFECKFLKAEVAERESSLRKVYSFFPEPIKAIIFLYRYLVKHWHLNSKIDKSWFSGDNSLLIMSYFFGVSLDKANEGIFESHYWNGLHQLFREQDINENWLHNFESSPSVSQIRAGTRLLYKVNDLSGEFSTHKFTQSFISVKLVCRVLKNWMKLLYRSLFLTVHSAFIPCGSRISLWPLLARDWFNGMRGPVAISNLIWIELFDEALKSIPHQTKGLYLCENQAWERAFIYAWHRHGHGQLFAVAHSTIRFWDLRYFNNTKETPEFNGIPLPDFIALNGMMAKKTLLDTGYNPDNVIEVEALRYQFLNTAPTTSKTQFDRKDSPHILILGDYVDAATEELLALINKARPLMRKNLTMAVKPHPACKISPELYPNLDLKVVAESLGEILHDYDLVFSSNMTSASVDAYCAELPVIILLDGRSLNFSPLRGYESIKFVSDAEELILAIESCLEEEKVSHDDLSLFFLDDELPRWKVLLNM